MADHQRHKALVQRYYAALDAAAPRKLHGVLKDFVSSNYQFRGVHPFNELDSSEAVADTVWRPLWTALSPIQRRPDIFMAGCSEIDGTDWVISMGHLMGLFDKPWLGIPPTGRMAFLRYAEFHQIRKGRISSTAFFCDIIGLMKQAGLTPLPTQTGAELLVPGPRTHDGLLHARQSTAESKKTLDLVNRMCDDLVNAEGFQAPSKLLARTWHDGMIWFGPSGIGSTYTIERYQEQHQGPFRAGLANVVFNGHLCRFAEGNYAGWFGWPNLTMDSTGGLMGLPAGANKLNMRVVDMYRREGDKLAENWIFIDMLYWMLQQNVDVLDRMRSLLRH
jgi:predicted ester cyclase